MTILLGLWLSKFTSQNELYTEKDIWKCVLKSKAYVALTFSVDILRFFGFLGSRN